MIRPSLLFLDIDGTILRSDYSLSPRVIAAVRALENAGTRIVLASGRSWEALRDIYLRLGLKSPAVCYNGAVVVGGPDGSVIFSIELDETVSRTVITLCRERELEMVGYSQSRLLYEKSGPYIDAYNRRVSLEGFRINFDDYDSLSLTKIIVFAANDRLLSIKDELEKQFGPDILSVMFSDTYFLELMGSGACKQSGLIEVCRVCKVPVDRTAAIGDNWNDADMLDAAGDSWIMGGAPDNLKVRFPADRRTAHVDDDGAALVMEAMLAGTVQSSRTASE